MPGLDDLGHAARMDALSDHSHGVLRDRPLAIGDGHLHAFGLGDDLAGDDQDIAVQQRIVGVLCNRGFDGGGNQCNEVIALTDLRQARNTPDGVARNGHG
jgi:hypothetical protein